MEHIQKTNRFCCQELKTLKFVLT